MKICMVRAPVVVDEIPGVDAQGEEGLPVLYHRSAGMLRQPYNVRCLGR